MEEEVRRERRDLKGPRQVIGQIDTFHLHISISFRFQKQLDSPHGQDEEIEQHPMRFPGVGHLFTTTGGEQLLTFRPDLQGKRFAGCKQDSHERRPAGGRHPDPDCGEALPAGHGLEFDPGRSHIEPRSRAPQSGSSQGRRSGKGSVLTVLQKAFGPGRSLKDTQEGGSPVALIDHMLG
jgi:hypothetical protein